MAWSYGAKYTEHAGAKNGGGAWDKRAYAKESSRIVRRYRDHIAERQGEQDYYEDCFWQSLGSSQSC